MRRGVHRSWLPLMAAALAVLVLLPSVASVAEASTTGRWTAKCDSRLRLWPNTSSRTLRILKAGAVVTTAGTVTGKRWSARCKGDSMTSRAWLKVVKINGKSVRSLTGHSVAYVAKGIYRWTPLPKPPPATEPVPETASVISNCPVRLRTQPSTEAGTTAIIDENMVVTAAESVSGGAWDAECGTTVSGNAWYRITEVGGQSVSSLYGVTQLFAATGLFRTASQSSYVEGIDVSKWQGTIDWGLVRASGKRFAIAKATEGVGYEDSQYDANKAGAMANGLAFGAYHFARPDLNSAIAEADWFADTAGYQPGMIIPTLDLELHGTKTAAELVAWVQAWVGRVYERLGVRPMIYASPSFWKTYMGNTTWFANNGYAMVWVAHWGVANPSVPGSNWGGKSWTFWQYSSTGHVPGISGAVDLDRYRFSSFDAVTVPPR
jgi:GH25 family lysozyme M1 (1,4-beta-N-acetylmuramidase)